MQGKSTAVVEGENGSDWLAVDIGTLSLLFWMSLFSENLL